MNPQMQKEAQPELSTYANSALNETVMLAEWGFDSYEMASLLWLRQWYQSGGSDRASVIRHLEFLRMLVQSGEMEL
jgi:hypothetical protein